MAMVKVKSRSQARPLLGIVTCRFRPNLPKRRPFGSQTRRFLGLCNDARKLGLRVVVFFAEDVDLSSDRIRGMTYSAKQRKWICKYFRYPDAIYNRVPTRTHEADERVASVLTTVQRLGIPLFNTRYLNKLEVFQVARSLPPVAAHVPDTRRLRKLQDFTSMLGKYKVVYLKRSDGTLGNGISVVTLAGKRVLWKRNVGRKVLETTLSKRQMDGIVAGYIERKRYLAQQGLNLVKYKGRPLDFRVLVQKRGDGRWRVTGVGTRVAGPKQITTHVPRGGKRLSFQQGIECAVGKNPERCRDLAARIQKLCCTVAQHVERSLGLHLAEASFDIGVDTSGRTWLIEMNSKPFLFDEKVIQAKARRYILEYARRVINNARRTNATPAEVRGNAV